MNRNIILLTSLMLLVGLAVFVIASEIESSTAIYKGWNLIYGFTPSSLNGQGFSFSHIKAIYTYIAQEGKYVRIYPNPENAIIDKYGDSYFEKQVMWVYSDATVEEEFTEYWLEEPLPLSQRQLYKGWDFVYLTQEVIQSSQHPDLTLDDIKGNCKIEKAYLWQGKWVDFTTVSPKNPPEMSPSLLGQNLVIKVSSDCKLGTSEGDIPSVPNLP